MKNITNMKNIVKQIILLWFCLLCGMSYGQGTGALYSNGIDGWQNMIRYDYNRGKYVTYSWAALGTENHFAQTDIHNNMLDAHVANGYFVQDFEIIGDYVFFCGYNASMSGFLGWFNIDDLFSGNGKVHIDETLSLHDVESLDNIEVYFDRLGRIHIAGVGQHLAPTGLLGYKAFEAVGNPLGNMQYKVADLSSRDLDPTLTVTNDYVVYVSRTANVASNNYGIGIVLEPFPKDNMFPTTTHPCYFFQTVGYTTCSGISWINAWDPYLRQIEATTKKGNTIAVCGYRMDVNCGVPTFVYTLVIREFDLSPLLYSSPIQMTSNNHITLPFDVSDIKELKYDPISQHYIVLFYHEVLAGTWRDAILTADYSSGYALSPVRVDYQSAYPNWSSWSLCLDGSSKYTASGWDNVNLNYHFWQDDVLSVNGMCTDVSWYSASKRSVDIDKKEDELSNVVGWYILNFLPNREVELHSETSILQCN